MGCSSETSSSSNQSDNENQSDFVEVEGMVQLKSGSVSIGSNDKSFKANERPAMEVILDYDFYMGIHEVTCGEYASVAKKAKLKTFKKCENDSLPLTDITYYDAILFANAKSKQDNLDTAYTYSKPLYDDDGHCTEMEGFAFHPDANAFRLPTEAEWVYAASLAWDVKKSWNSDNSDYKLHPVCSIWTDSTGFCDMAGNAMEWVNDWMGTFRDTTVTNYVGAPDGGDLGERIVKGGRYSSTPKELNPYSRGDVYTVTSATRADYVGFRLAFGKIPNPLWMGDDGKSQSSVITPLAQSETLKKLTGTYNVKLSFHNDISGNVEQDSNWLQKRYKYYYENFEMLKDLAKTCFEHNIVLIGIITPRSPQYKETGSFGYHGLLRSEAPALIQEIADIGKTYPNFILMDENKMGDHDYTEDMAFDFDHLNRNGAAQLTARIDALLKTLE